MTSGNGGMEENGVLAVFTGERPGTPGERARIARACESAERSFALFTAGLEKLAREGAGVSDRKRAQQFAHMLGVLESLPRDTADGAAVREAVADAVARAKWDLLGVVLPANLGPVLASGLLEPLIERLDDEKFKRLAVALRFLRERAAAGRGLPGMPDRETVDRADARLGGSERAARLAKAIDQKYRIETARKKNLAARLKEGVGSVLKGEKYCFMDDQVMRLLPDTVGRLYHLGKPLTAEKLINRLRDGLEDDDLDVRSAAAGALTVVNEEIHLLPGPILAALKTALRRGRTPAPPDPASLSPPGPGEKPPPGDTAWVPAVLEAADRHVAGGDPQAAVALLSDHIVRCARKKTFEAADRLREKLSAIDPMAFVEIVRTGEAIEEAREGAVDRDFLDIWNDLIRNMSTGEIFALHDNLKTVTRDSDCSLFEQGQLNNFLIFVIRGELKLVCRREEKEIFLKKLSGGDIAGADTVFDYSVCTTSLITLSRVKLGMLDQATLDRWREEHPALAARLRRYALERETATALVEEKGVDRRVHQRRPCAGTVWVQILSARQNPLGKPFRGQLADISAGGIAFTVRTSKPESVRLLLGRSLQLQFALPPKGDPPLRRRGTVTAVKVHDHRDYSIHVAFAVPMMTHVVNRIADGCPPPA